MRRRSRASGARHVDGPLSPGDVESAYSFRADGEGYRTGSVSGCGHGRRYHGRWDGDGAFPCTDAAWTGVGSEQLIIYELHVGAFTSRGTFAAAAERFDDLTALGITAIEVTPTGTAADTRPRGYDGVTLDAPARVYGGRQGFQRSSDAAHARDMRVSRGPVA